MDFLEFLVQKNLAKSGGGGVTDSRNVTQWYAFSAIRVPHSRQDRVRREP